jgi:hypothetical protein
MAWLALAEFCEHGAGDQMSTADENPHQTKPNQTILSAHPPPVFAMH